MPRPTVTVPPEILMYAFSYALGRRTYAASDVARQLVLNVDLLPPHWQQLVVRDIKTARDEGRIGMEMDDRTWSEVQVRFEQALIDL